LKKQLSNINSNINTITATIVLVLPIILKNTFINIEVAKPDIIKPIYAIPVEIKLGNITFFILFLITHEITILSNKKHNILFIKYVLNLITKILFIIAIHKLKKHNNIVFFLVISL